MNFDFSDDQKLLRDQARKFLTDKCDRTVVRSILEDNKKIIQIIYGMKFVLWDGQAQQYLKNMVG